MHSPVFLQDLTKVLSKNGQHARKLAHFRRPQFQTGSPTTKQPAVPAHFSKRRTRPGRCSGIAEYSAGLQRVQRNTLAADTRIATIPTVRVTRRDIRDYPKILGLFVQINRRALTMNTLAPAS